MSEMDDLVKEFLVESRDNLDQMDRDLLGLEKDPASAKLLAGIFRTIHTIKGTSGFLSFGKLEGLTHAGENLLSRLRDGHLRLNAKITSGLLALVDGVRVILANIEADGQEGPNDYRELAETLNRLRNGTPCEADPCAPLPAEPASEVVATAATGVSEGDAPLGQLLVEHAGVDPAAVESARELQRQGDVRAIGEILVAQGAVCPVAAQEVIESQRESRAAALGDTSIRVDVALLDKLINLVGELVLTRNQIVQFSGRGQDAAFLNASQRLNLITSELQCEAMKTRMQPVGNLWSRLPRVVRDLAVAGGKQIRVEMGGKDTELDKTLIEAIKDPLTHIVRNCVDHGIELPEKRVAAGKPVEGCISLRAFHEGGQVNIEITDDGAGISLDRVRLNAVAKGLITADQAARMGEREIANLVFLPGFSTAQKVTNVSGRGVGMDVVKTNVEKVGGMVDLHSRPGKGTILKIKIPLTLAIIPALVVTCAGDRYAIPQVSLLELVRLEADDAYRRIETIQGAPVFRLRPNLLPLVYLDRELELRKHTSGGGFYSAAGAASAVNIVVLQADSRQFGLVVDDIDDTQEIVVKPLSRHLKSNNIFAGATIMGDGKVALILDVLGLAQHANVVSEVRDHVIAEVAVEMPKPVAASSGARRVLVFESRAHQRMAIALSHVARLEEFELHQVEYCGCGRVVQYRGRIMPLLAVDALLGGGAETAAQAGEHPLRVVVFDAGGHSAGLVVHRVLDITEEQFQVQPGTRRPGVLGSAVIQKRTTEVLDVRELLAAAGMSVSGLPAVA